MTKKEYIERRSQIAKDLRDLHSLALSDKRDLTAEEKTKYDRMVDDIEQLDAVWKREESLSDIEQRQEAMAEESRVEDLPNPEIRAQVPEQRNNEKDQAAEFRNFLGRGIVPDTRAMTTETGSTGGYLIPEVFSSKLFEYAKDDSIIRQLATVERWKGDGAFPVCTDFGSSYLVGEGDQVTTNTGTFGQETVSGFQLMWRREIPRKLIDNAAYNIESKIPLWWAKSNSNKEEDYWAAGAGTTEPAGLSTLATAGTDTSSNSAIAGDDVINWYYDCPETYRKRATWIFADATIARIRKIKNTVTGSGALQYMWTPGLAGSPDTLMGRPIHASAGMAAFAAGATVGVFGDIAQYLIVDFGSPLLIRDPYSVATYDQIRFVGRRLIDAALPVAEAIIACNVTS